MLTNTACFTANDTTTSMSVNKGGNRENESIFMGGFYGPEIKRKLFLWRYRKAQVKGRERPTHITL